MNLNRWAWRWAWRWVWMLGGVGTLGCGVSTQADLVTVGGRHACEFYQRCGQIAAGQTYTTQDECLTDQKAFWNKQWPAADCDGRVNNESLDFCVKAMETTACGSFVDQLQTIYVKCAKSDVCSGKS